MSARLSGSFPETQPEINRILQRPEVRELFLTNDLVLLGGTPDALGDYLKIEIARWAKVIKEAGIKPE